jgi:hypothetical protein
MWFESRLLEAGFFFALARQKVLVAKCVVGL